MRSAIPILRKVNVPAAKRLGTDLLELAVPENAEVVSVGRNFKKATKNVGRQTLRKQLGSGGRKKLQAESLQQNRFSKTNQSVAKRQFYKHFSLIMSRNFRYQPFVAISGNVGGKILVVDDVSPSHEQEIYPTTSFDEYCIDFEFQTDRNYYVDLRQTYLALTLKYVKGCGYETYNTKEKKSKRKGKNG